jgi:hypothetical protein
VPLEPSINDERLHAAMTGLINASGAKQNPFSRLIALNKKKGIFI